MPAGVQTLNVDIDVLMNAPGDVMSSHSLAIINWNRALLYQDGVDSHEYDSSRRSFCHPVGITLRRCAIRCGNGNRVDFATTDLRTLVDSPLDMGQFVKKWDLWRDGAAFVQLDAFADQPQDLDVPPELLAAYKRIPAEAFAMYGSGIFTIITRC